MMERRTFLKRASAAVSGLIATVIGLPAIRYLLDPLTRGRKTSEYIRVAPLSSLPPGRPVIVPVVAERVDAYTRYPPGAIGNVFLVRQSDAPDAAVTCFQVTCPHLGCAIEYAEARGRFACPCHASDFAPDGSVLSGPSPRGMDQLECRISEPDATGQHWVEVKYQEFEAGIAERRPRA